jgi:DNA-binding HxlR family transcriptional regulator
LTPLGREAAAHIRHLVDWIESNLSRVEAARAQSERKRAVV